MAKINPAKLEARLKGKEIVLLVLSKAEYSEQVLGLVAAISKKTPSICYVSVNKSANALVKLFGSEKINLKEFQFIDCVSNSAASGEKKKEPGGSTILYVSSPRSLTELSITIDGVIGAGCTEAVVVDALTTFLIYNDGLTVVRFAHNLISTLREKEKKGFFIALKNDISGSLLDDLSMFVDGVVEV